MQSWRILVSATCRDMVWAGELGCQNVVRVSLTLAESATRPKQATQCPSSFLVTTISCRYSAAPKIPFNYSIIVTNIQCTIH
jgi:hypothetical protein